MKIFRQYKQFICKHDYVMVHPEFLVATFKLHFPEHQKDLHFAFIKHLKYFTTLDFGKNKTVEKM